MEIMEDPNYAYAFSSAIVLTTAVALMARSKQKKNALAGSTSPAAEPPLSADPFGVFYDNFLGPRLPMYVRDLSIRTNSKVLEAPQPPWFLWFLPSPRFFVVTDYQTARRVLEDPKSAKWDRANIFFAETTGGANLVTSEGPRWRHVRKSTSIAFSSSSIAKLTETIQMAVKDWIKETLEPAICKGTSMDILNEMNLLTSDVIFRAAFDHRTTRQERTEALKALETCWIEFGDKSTRNPARQVAGLQWLFSGVRKAKAASKVLVDLCRKLLKEYCAKTEKQPHKIIDMIVNDPDYQNDDERICDMIAYMVAGFDTTANTLAFLFREMAMQKNLQTQLRNELLQCHSPQARRNSRFLRNVVRETLRLYPAAAVGSIRCVGTDIDASLPNGTMKQDKVVIPAGSVALASTYAIQRDPDVYEHPDTFNPDRWNNPDEDQLRSYLTFGAGRRNCQGQALAYAEMYEVVSMLFVEYEFDIVQQGEPQNIVLFKPIGTLLSVKKVKPSS